MDRTSQVDHFLIVRKLAAGGNAEVQLARNTHTGALVALKVTKGINGDIQPYVSLYHSEINALNRLSHPNIVRIFDTSASAVYKCASGSEFPVLYISMELLPNGELFRIIEHTGRMEEPLARACFRQILEAVGHCHENGITHRDLKPENILLDELFNLKLVDFGFAAPTQGRTGRGFLRTMLGSKAYMAPEILQHRPYSGVSVDLFACGAILFVLVNGGPAFVRARQSDSYYQLFTTNNARFWSLHSGNYPQGFFSPDFQDLINGLLAFDPAERPTMRQVLESPWLNGPTLTLEGARAEMAVRHARALARETGAQP